MSMKASELRVVCYGGKEMRFFTGMHISRTKLYSDSVHLFLCNKYVFQIGIYVDMSFTHDIVVPPASEVWKWECQMPVKASVVHFSSSHTACYQRQRGHTAAITAPHNRARYKDVTFRWFFKAFNGNDILFHFAFRVPYIYACFYNVSFNMLMYIL